jgi:hypothetical protein
MTQRTWLIPLAAVFALCGIAPASGEWMQAVTVDRLTRQTNITMTNAALNSARQFGRKVSAKLVLQCVQSAEGRLPRVAIIFSEPIASGAVRTKYRIDNDPIRRNLMASVENDGATLVLGWDAFISRLPSSSIVYIEFSFSSAGATLLEFDTSGAIEAFDRIQCVRPRKQK